LRSLSAFAFFADFGRFDAAPEIVPCAWPIMLNFQHPGHFPPYLLGLGLPMTNTKQPMAAHELAAFKTFRVGHDEPSFQSGAA